MLSILKKYFSFLGSRKRLVQIGIIWSVIKSIAVGLQFIAIYFVLNDIINDNLTSKTAYTSFFIMLLSLILMILATNFGRMSEIEGAFGMCADKRNEIGDKMKYFPMGYFNSNSMGFISSTVTTTLDTIQNEGMRVITNLVFGMIHGAVLTIFMICFDYRIGIIVVLGFLLFIGINTLMQRKSIRISPARHHAQINLVGAVLEYFNGLAVVRSYNLASQTGEKLIDAIDTAKEQNIGLEIAFIPFMFLQSLSLKVTSLVIIICSTIFCINGTMALPMCALMIIASFDIFKEVEVAGGMSAIVRLVDNAMKDVEKILQEPLINEGSITTSKNNDIICENISFSYDNKKIIDDVSLKIPEGSLTAVVGPSGGGKSTLCHLFSRFWDVDEGTITLGHKNIKDYQYDYLLSKFSLVFQDVYLFHDTIANNIRFGKPNASMDEIIKVSRKACCHDFIIKLPDGYDTVIGEGGSSISGGEKQRISIARAILKDAPIVILDEATSNVDPENEKSLQLAIEELTNHKTVIMIAHRLKTVQRADQILVLEDGVITEKGRHKELLKNNCTYSNFVKMRENSIGWKLGRV